MKRVRPPDVQWQDYAACRDSDPSVFFPTDHAPNQYAKARKICSGCEVRAECLDWALRYESYGRASRSGMFGGMTPSERDQVLHGG